MIVSTSFAQDKKATSDYTFCNETSNTLTYDEIIKCQLVNKKDSKVEVLSFTIGYTVEGKYREWKVKGNKLSNEVLNDFKVNKENITKIFIDEITINKDNSKVIVKDGFSFKLKK